MHKFDFGKSKKKEGVMMMSEKKREEEENEAEEEESLDHFIHEHPLSLIESDVGDRCKGCDTNFTGEAAYGCKKCGNERVLHEDCAEMAREIWHPLHPQHTLVQKRVYIFRTWDKCALCERYIDGIGYVCTSSDDKFLIHLRCAAAKGVERVGDVHTSMMHPSHPKHPLILVRRRHSFKCDACGAMETDRSYDCTTCQYLIHERCATLPAKADFHHLHHHPISLAFYLPFEYIEFDYVCDVCRRKLQLNRWVYHCELCRYVAHVKCATKPPLPPTTLSKILIQFYHISKTGLIRFPMHDVYEEIIKPFVAKEIGGEEKMIVVEDHKYWTPNHHHQLIMSLVVSSDHINDDDDGDEDETELTICDGCTMPIISDQKQAYMMSCSSSSSECKYFLHLGCFFLPPELPSHPLHEAEADHKLVLQPCPKLDFSRYCYICRFPTNGLVYSCTKCDFKADIRCASLPNTIQHSAHPNHYLHLILRNRTGLCRGCGFISYSGISYKCGSCEFMVCIRCALLPPTNKHKLEKHPLPLTYDANLNHPDRFCCDACEFEMNPKKWMYHCRECDTSFHPRCFPATSGEYRNIKFGHRYAVLADVHPHPLTYSLLTTKLRCDVCRFRLYELGPLFDQRGFHCPSCNFFMCLRSCGLYLYRNDSRALD